LQALADKDINAKIEGNMVIVDKDDVQSSQKILKSIGCTKKFKGGLNESLTKASNKKEYDNHDDWYRAARKNGYTVRKHPNYAKNAKLVAYDGTEVVGTFTFAQGGEIAYGTLNESLTEAVDGINNSGIGYIIPYTLQFIAQAHTWHLLCPNGQKHMALGELYDELQTEVDGLAEKFIAQGGRLETVSLTLTAYYDELEVRARLEEFRNIVSSAITTDSRLASISDGLTDLQEVIDSKLYKFNMN
jgi:hypothetical protein